MTFDEIVVTQDARLQTQFETGESPLRRWGVPLLTHYAVETFWVELTCSGKLVLRLPESAQRSGRMVLPLAGLRALLDEVASVEGSASS